jgi:hypothetical protein
MDRIPLLQSTTICFFCRFRGDHIMMPNPFCCIWLQAIRILKRYRQARDVFDHSWHSAFQGCRSNTFRNTSKNDVSVLSGCFLWFPHHSPMTEYPHETRITVFQASPGRIPAWPRCGDAVLDTVRHDPRTQEHTGFTTPLTTRHAAFA